MVLPESNKQQKGNKGTQRSAFLPLVHSLLEPLQSFKSVSMEGMKAPQMALSPECISCRWWCGLDARATLYGCKAKQQYHKSCLRVSTCVCICGAGTEPRARCFARQIPYHLARSQVPKTIFTHMWRKGRIFLTTNFLCGTPILHLFRLNLQ